MMKNFGLLKTKIEYILLNSYKTEAFKTELRKFKKNVLENKDVTQLYYLYDSLLSKQGLSKEDSELFLAESVAKIRELTKKVNTKSIEEWTKGVKVENHYTNIDIIVEGKVTKIKDIIEVKKTLTEGLQKEADARETVKLPLKTMFNVVNQTLNEHLSELTEEDREVVKSITTLSKDEIIKEVNEMKSSLVIKLENNLLEQTDVDVINKLTETLKKVKTEEPNSLSLYRLRKLGEVL